MKKLTILILAGTIISLAFTSTGCMTLGTKLMLGVAAYSCVSNPSAFKAGFTNRKPSQPSKPSLPKSRPVATRKYVTTIKKSMNGRDYFRLGLAAYKSFEYKNVVRALTAAKNSGDLTKNQLAEANAYLGASLFLLGDSQGAKAAFREARRFGIDHLDSYIFPKDMIRCFENQ